jgi:hypothetical protein
MTQTHEQIQSVAARTLCCVRGCQHPVCQLCTSYGETSGCCKQHIGTTEWRKVRLQWEIDFAEGKLRDWAPIAAKRAIKAQISRLRRELEQTAMATA